MLIVVPGGIILMLLRQSRFRVLRGLGVSIVEFFRNLPLILLVYRAYYVVPQPSRLEG
jgi:polar amino acid transport system permease protein